MRVTGDFLRGRGRFRLSEAEKDALEASVERVETLPARTIVTSRGQRVRYSTLLLDGTMCRYMDARDGFRQLVALQVAGDFIDLHGFPLEVLDHDVGTLTESRIAVFPHARIEALMERMPHLARWLWRSTLLDAALHREWIFRLGRLDAVGRVFEDDIFGDLEPEFAPRLAAVGRAGDMSFPLALTQQDLGEACGLTSVHVNRTLRRLREEGLADFSRGKVTIMDLPRLSRVAEFDPDYLYLDEGPWQQRLAS